MDLFYRDSARRTSRGYLSILILFSFFEFQCFAVEEGALAALRKSISTQEQNIQSIKEDHKKREGSTSNPVKDEERTKLDQLQTDLARQQAALAVLEAQPRTSDSGSKINNSSPGSRNSSDQHRRVDPAVDRAAIEYARVNQNSNDDKTGINSPQFQNATDAVRQQGEQYRVAIEQGYKPYGDGASIKDSRPPNQIPSGDVSRVTDLKIGESTYQFKGYNNQGEAVYQNPKAPDDYRTIKTTNGKNGPTIVSGSTFQDTAFTHQPNTVDLSNGSYVGIQNSSGKIVGVQDLKGNYYVPTDTVSTNSYAFYKPAPNSQAPGYNIESGLWIPQQTTTDPSGSSSQILTSGFIVPNNPATMQRFGIPVQAAPNSSTGTTSTQILNFPTCRSCFGL